MAKIELYFGNLLPCIQNLSN